MARENSITLRVSKDTNQRMKSLVLSSEMSVSQFMDTALNEIMDAIESKHPPDMLPTVKLFREKLGRKNGLSPEIRAGVKELLKEMANEEK